MTTADVTAYVAQRQIEGAANATINRELSALKRMYSLAVAAEKIHRAPRITKLQEHNVRQGFFEREQFEAVRRHLRESLKPIVTFACITMKMVGHKTESICRAKFWAKSPKVQCAVVS